MKTIVSRLKANSFARNTAIMFGGNMLTNVVAYLYHLVVGRILGPSQYGELAALISIFYMLNAPATVLQNVLTKFFSTLKARRADGQAKKLFLIATTYIAIVELIMVFILIPFAGAISGFLHLTHTIYVIWLYFIFAVFLLAIVSVSVLQGYQRFLDLTIVTNAGSVVRLVFGAIAAFFGVGWTLIANIASNVVTYAASLIPLRRIVRSKEQHITLTTKSALVYSVPTFITMTSIAALYSQDVILVKHFFVATEAGLYSSLSVLGKVIFFASSSVISVAFPMLAERSELNRSVAKIIAGSLAVVGGISTGVTVLYVAFPSLIVRMLYGNAFAAASMYMGPFGLFISFFSLANTLSTMYLAIGETKIWMIAVVAALTQTVLIVFRHGSLGAVITNNIAVCAGLFFALLLYYPYATRKR